MENLWTLSVIDLDARNNGETYSDIESYGEMELNASNYIEIDIDIETCIRIDLDTEKYAHRRLRDRNCNVVNILIIIL